jgi:hypothetical protein
MAKLTDDQRRFLFEQKIPLSMVFDGTGMKPSQYKPRMEELGMLFVFGITPCKKSGHTLRSKSGSCIQCNTAYIEYQKRSVKNASVYLAGSPSTRLLKIGMTTDIDRRRVFLNQHRYGDVQDWEMLISVQTEDAGRMEFQVHQALNDFSVDGAYIKEGRRQQCYELFRCSYMTARSALSEVLSEKQFRFCSGEERMKAVYWG